MKFSHCLTFLVAAGATYAALRYYGFYHEPVLTVENPSIATKPPPDLVALSADQENFAPAQADPLLIQIRQFIALENFGRMQPKRVAAALAFLSNLGPRELATACTEAVASTQVESLTYLLQLALECWGNLQPEATLDFILQQYPRGLSDFAALHPSSVVQRFKSTTGWTPHEAVFLHDYEFDQTWRSANLLAAEAALPQGGSRAAVLRQFEARVNQARMDLASPDAAVREAARNLSTPWFGEKPVEAFVALLRYRCALQGPAFNPMNSGSDALVMYFAWMGDWDHFSKAIQAIPDPNERDGIATHMARVIGCIPSLTIARLNILRAAHSTWESHPDLPNLIRAIPAESASEVIPFVAQLPQNAFREQCLAALANTNYTDPRCAPSRMMDEALALSLDDSRRSAVHDLYAAWREQAPNLAFSWLNRQTPEHRAWLQSRSAE